MGSLLHHLCPVGLGGLPSTVDLITCGPNWMEGIPIWWDSVTRPIGIGWVTRPLIHGLRFGIGGSQMDTGSLTKKSNLGHVILIERLT
jgi:hypothetical protein